MAFKIAVKDFKLFLTDRAAIVLTFIVPIIMILVFGFAFGGMSGGSSLPKVRLPIVDLDKTPESSKLLAGLAKTGAVRPLAEDSHGSPFTAASARRAVRDGDRYAALVIPKGFGQAIKEGEQPRLRVYYDPSQEVASSMVTGALQQAAAQALGQDIARARTTRGIEQMGLPPLEKQMALQIAMSSLGSAQGRQMTAFIGVEALAETAKKKEEWPARAHAVAGPTVMFLLFSVAYGGRSILEERESGTLRRLLISPMPKRNILFGKGLYLLVRGTFQVCLMFAIGWLIFGLRVQDHAGPLLLVIFLTAAACSSFGLLLASACSSARQVDGLATLIVLAMSALGGSMFPRIIMPDWMKTAGLFTVNSWSMDAFWGIFWRDFGFAQIGKDAAVLAGITIVMTAISIRLFNTRVTKGA
jgi:ABC-2 type transport system permease protein